MIVYRLDARGVGPEQLGGFFQGWTNPPSRETHLRLLERSDHVVLAVDDETGGVVGFVTAVTDGVLAAYVPLLEVLPGYRGRGIGRELMLRLREALRGYYMIDVVCGEALRPFYESLGFRPMLAMAIRDYERQSGRGRDEDGARSE